ncbi:HK97 gp10 family phage protein [Pectobacterium brasiliense]|uniref:HK97 gp10 family phage protein n=1 Tax=Pectobacterium brasiliense TaxID=180957 RepID=UPI0025A2FAB0|nr:HK97 gp10 family phage protein [Pectobacterium brasiliense]WJM80436.1 HK97 gp10 family phage protein [Pectobacterium brasiliense]
MARVKVTGIRQSQAKLNARINDIQGRKAVRAVQSALYVGMELTALYTPIGKTSNLIKSRYSTVDVKGTRLIGIGGYTAGYAVYTHDPAIKQNFRRSTAKKEYLKLSFEESKAQIDAVVKKEMSL